MKFGILKSRCKIGPKERTLTWTLAKLVRFKSYALTTQKLHFYFQTLDLYVLNHTAFVEWKWNIDNSEDNDTVVYLGIWNKVSWDIWCRMTFDYFPLDKQVKIGTRTYDF